MMTNQETDAALILENELARRVREVMKSVVSDMVRNEMREQFAIMKSVVSDMVRNEMREQFAKQKESMLMEISITIGKHLRLIENEERKPLWESTPEEFGLTHEDLNTHNIQKVDHAIREQTPSL